MLREHGFTSPDEFLAQQIDKQVSSRIPMTLGFRHYGPGGALGGGGEEVFGPKDPIDLALVRKFHLFDEVIASLHGRDPAQLWTVRDLKLLKDYYAYSGFKVTTFESLAFSEKMKAGLKGWEADTEVWAQSLRNIAEVFKSPTITLNMMEVRDWTRTPVRPDGSWDDLEQWVDPTEAKAIGFDSRIAESYDVSQGFPKRPGWGKAYTESEIRELTEHYKQMGWKGVHRQIAKVIEKVLPVLEQTDAQIAIHIDDPAMDINIGGIKFQSAFGCDEHFEHFFDVVKTPRVGLNLCTGSLLSNPDNDVLALTEKWGKKNRIKWVHLRNLHRLDEYRFVEAPHIHGDLDIFKFLSTLYDTGFRGLIRMDHGRKIGDNEVDPGVLGYALLERVIAAAHMVYGHLVGLEQRSD